MQGNSQPPSSQPQEFQEYRLKSATAANVSHNVMILNGTAASFSDFTPPVRLIRDRKYNFSDEEDDGEEDEDGDVKMKQPIQAGRGKKKRTRIVYQEDEDELALREQESAPWLLEDFDGQHAFQGKLEGGQHSNYVFFVNQGKEFRVIPISRWYRFQPKLNYQPLSIEEAEKQLASGTSSRGPGGLGIGGGEVDRWLMHKTKPKAGADEDEAGGEAKRRKLAQLLSKPLAQKPLQRRQREDDDREDLDFEDIFDDDDEGQLDLEAVPEEPAASKKGKNLTAHGKQVKKLIKQLDSENYHDDDEEEEEDPYAEEYGEEEEDEDREAARTEAMEIEKVSVLLSSSQQAKVFAPQPKQTSAGSSVAPTRTASPGHGSAITESDIIELLAGQPMRTKDLVAKLKPKLKADPANKDILRDLMKRLAMVRPGGSEEEKLLELKPEYRR